MGSLSEQVFLPQSLCCSDSSKGKKESPWKAQGKPLPLLSTELMCHQSSAFRRNHALRKFSNIATPSAWVIYTDGQTTGKCSRGEFCNTNKHTVASTAPRNQTWQVKPKAFLLFQNKWRGCVVPFRQVKETKLKVMDYYIQCTVAFLWRFYSAPTKDLPINIISVYKGSSEYILLLHVPQVTLACTSETGNTLTLK